MCQRWLAKKKTFAYVLISEYSSKNGCEKAEKSLGVKELVARSFASKTAVIFFTLPFIQITIFLLHLLFFRTATLGWAPRFNISERKKTKCLKKS